MNKKQSRNKWLTILSCYLLVFFAVFDLSNMSKIIPSIGAFSFWFLILAILLGAGYLSTKLSEFDEKMHN